jgi:mRNA interferase MazF
LLLICCQINSSIRGGATEVPVNNLNQPLVVASNLIPTLSWKGRKARPIVAAENGVLDLVLIRVIPLIGADGVTQG